ncbi:MAG: chemotaxis protein CheB, partial [Spirochaetota bacterium]
MAKKRQKQHETREEGEASGPIVVEIGASAGGVHALQELFRTMPADIGMAFVAIIHMKPDASSHLESVLRNVTDLRVVTIEDGVAIEANTIYVAPPGNAVETESNQLYLVPAPSEVPPSHVNHFFRSLAAHVGQRALGIVLSGMGTDGSIGLKEIKANLGITCVQDPDEAEYPSMPQ